MELSAFIKDLAENAIFIIYFEKMAASKKNFDGYNDAL